MEKFKEEMERAVEKMELELKNISEEYLIQHVAPKIPKREDILSNIALEKSDSNIVSRKLDLKSVEIQQTVEHLDNPQKLELSTIISDRQNVREDSIFNSLTTDDALYDLGESAITDGSTSSATSQSSFEVLEPKSSAVHQEFELDYLKVNENNLSLKESDIADYNTAVQDSFSEMGSTTVSKYFDYKENPVEKQVKFFSLCVKKK